MELNRPEDIEWNPRDPSGKPRLYVAFTNHTGQTSLDQDGAVFDPATHATQSLKRATPWARSSPWRSPTPRTRGASIEFLYFEVWHGSKGQGDFDASCPDNLLLDRDGGVWFGTDGNFGVASHADAFYYLDLDPAHRAGQPGVTQPSFGKAFRVVGLPSDAEATGPSFTPDMGTIFMSVQHPGENAYSTVAEGRRLPVERHRGHLPARVIPSMPARRARLLSAPLAFAAVSAVLAAGARCGGGVLRPARHRGRARRARGQPRGVDPADVLRGHGQRRERLLDVPRSGSDRTRSPITSSSASTASRTRARKNPLDEPARRDLSAAAARTSDAEILEYIREDNYAPLRRGARCAPGLPGLRAGSRPRRRARRGGLRARRERLPGGPGYKPFPGSFWPTNGSAGDVFLRLPAAFREDASGAPSREVYKLNLALLEAAIASPSPLLRRARPACRGGRRAGGGAGERAPRRRRSRRRRRARARGDARSIRPPARYAGGAAGVPVRAWLYPRGAELLHSVRYLDPDRPALLSPRG